MVPNMHKTGVFCGGREGRIGGNSPPPKKIPNSLLPSQNLKIAKFWVGGAFPHKWNMNIIINIKLVSGKPYNLEYKNG
jgi:hypothetical protein